MFTYIYSWLIYLGSFLLIMPWIWYHFLWLSLGDRLLVADSEFACLNMSILRGVEFQVGSYFPSAYHILAVVVVSETSGSFS